MTRGDDRSTEKKHYLEDLLDETIPPPSSPVAHRRAASSGLICAFFLVFLHLTCYFHTSSGVIPSWRYLRVQGPQNDDLELAKTQSTPDYYQYVWHRTLEWTPGDGRLIVVGDVHGMVAELKTLLVELDYSPQDTLVFAGDLVAKHPSIRSSIDTVSYISSLNAHAIRGNHDNYVIAWRYWMERASRKAGVDNLEEWEALEENNKPSGLLDYPKADWDWQSQHFKIARRMSKADFDYLRNASLTIHIPSIHSYIVHAGLLPLNTPKGDYRRPSLMDQVDQSKQPLEGELKSTNPFYFTPSEERQIALESAEPYLMLGQNRDPYTMLEMRGVEHAVPSKKSDGKSWHKLWNTAMRKCSKPITKRQGDEEEQPVGDQEDQSEFEDGDEEETDEKTDEVADETPSSFQRCERTNIIYGHWAAERLHIGRYTFGLDSGAVYGDHLSALVIGGPAFNAESKPRLKIKHVEIDGLAACIAGLPCQKP